jgi:hypothetical protein
LGIKLTGWWRRTYKDLIELREIAGSKEGGNPRVVSSLEDREE